MQQQSLSDIGLELPDTEMSESATVWPTPQAFDAMTFTRPQEKRQDGRGGYANLRERVKDASPTLTSSVGVSRASRIALQENARLHLTTATSGESSTESFAKLDPDGCWLKMSAGCYHQRMDGSLVEFSGTWPSRGMMRNGVCSVLPPWERRTSASGSSLWRSPTAHDWKNTGCSTQVYLSDQVRPEQVTNPAKKMWPTATAVDRPNEGNVRLLRAKVLAGELSEEEATAMLGKSPMEAQGKVKMWPTPRSGKVTNENEASWRARQERGDVATPPLSLAVKMWPTPKGSPSGPDYARANREGSGGDDLATAIARQSWPTPLAGCGPKSHNQMNAPLREAVGGQLNPTWVEWLMGFPLGWTDLDASETE